MDYYNYNPAELAALINTAASAMCRNKCADEIEMMAILFDLLSDTLFAIAVIEKKQEKLKRKNDD
ncbi:MAG: hypothetical protein FWF82_07240 [Oscillospiraceae bacterium]|nr:hypothetical protein [Oscillospiraceae bacterium]